MDWLIYGAYGFSGQLIAEEAVRRGHRPVLAGRSAEKLAPLAERLNLDYRVFALDDLTALTRAIGDVALVLHTAGPFIQTSGPMLKACTLAGVHYLDITGEYPVFEQTFTFDEAARRQRIALISGVGFDVVPSDCLALYVAQQVPGADQLESAFEGLGGLSSGTARSGIQLAAAGGRVRRGGQLVPLSFGAGMKTVRFPHGTRSAMPIPWGDLATAYRSTSIPNITTYMVAPGWMGLAARLLSPFLLVPPLRQLAVSSVGALLHGPDAHMLETGKAWLWARASAADGRSAEAWLQTPEPYRFTALAAVQCAESVLADSPSGALTPAQAFGADFVLSIEGTRRWDTLDYQS